MAQEAHSLGRPGADPGVLYMAALIAAHYNPVVRACYQRLRATGKAKKVV